MSESTVTSTNHQSNDYTHSTNANFPIIMLSQSELSQYVSIPLALSVLLLILEASFSSYFLLKILCNREALRWGHIPSQCSSCNLWSLLFYKFQYYIKFPFTSFSPSATMQQVPKQSEADLNSYFYPHGDLFRKMYFECLLYVQH